MHQPELTASAHVGGLEEVCTRPASCPTKRVHGSWDINRSDPNTCTSSPVALGKTKAQTSRLTGYHEWDAGERSHGDSCWAACDARGSTRENNGNHTTGRDVRVAGCQHGGYSRPGTIRHLKPPRRSRSNCSPRGREYTPTAIFAALPTRVDCVRHRSYFGNEHGPLSQDGGRLENGWCLPEAVRVSLGAPRQLLGKLMVTDDPERRVKWTDIEEEGGWAAQSFSDVRQNRIYHPSVGRYQASTPREAVARDRTMEVLLMRATYLGSTYTYADYNNSSSTGGKPGEVDRLLHQEFVPSSKYSMLDSDTMYYRHC
ncbi:hypothetical protein P168DRAFT_284908 [Aspergillus campestris IBT 28561]|uniref:Uncharacterized protein n=1 Tax=Aspergillus campestris (strain IBT 28561) TaxID=1392248 RepID=A0A2I1CT01_ASPC2|nr:uncharacterized protein P168DRAFT_284908 [Aspergillus campestris IBT 28561]PKY00741.1 hypothetical protein P168DRAFT_284908 [Aspergillus campestris IBT 28561]